MKYEVQQFCPYCSEEWSIITRVILGTSEKTNMEGGSGSPLVKDHFWQDFPGHPHPQLFRLMSCGGRHL
jgi:hypothetical protein